MLDPEEAWQRIDELLEPLDVVEVARAEAVDHVLGRAVAATVDMPPADVSAMDGYAVADPGPGPAGAVEVGEPVPVVGTAVAGNPPAFELSAGQAAKIMTGAVVPRGADRVVPIEQSDGGAETVRFSSLTEAGAHIRRRAEVVAAGDPLVEAGTLLGPGTLSLLASHGLASVPVIRQPTVSMLATGDELVPAESTPGPGQLRDSNSPFVLAAGRSLGLDVRSLGIASDRRDDLEQKIRQGLESDVLLLSGGVSKGELDLVEEVLDQAGCRRLFDAVAMQPGKPLVVAVHEEAASEGAASEGAVRRRWIFGLPGNPGSVMMTFWLFVRPTLRRLQGLDDGYWRGALSGRLTAPLPPTKGRDRFLPARVRFEAGEIRVEPIAQKGSHDTLGYGLGTAIVRAPKRRPATAVGEPCEILPLADWRW